MRNILRVPVSLFRCAGAGPVRNQALARGRGICILPRMLTRANALPRDGSIWPEVSGSGMVQAQVSSDDLQIFSGRLGINQGKS